MMKSGLVIGCLLLSLLARAGSRSTLQGIAGTWAVSKFGFASLSGTDEAEAKKSIGTVATIGENEIKFGKDVCEPKKISSRTVRRRS